MADSGEVFEVFECEELKGRSLRALKSLKPSDKVLESTPAVFVLSNNVRGLSCDLCFAKREELQRCSKCKFARYCGRECQKKAWKEHKIECERITRVAPNIPTDLVRLMARIMQKTQLDNTFSNDLTQLVSHQEQLGASKTDAFSAISTVLIQFIGEREFQKTSLAELFELFGKISCNSFTICDAELQPLGKDLYVRDMGAIAEYPARVSVSLKKNEKYYNGHYCYSMYVIKSVGRVFCNLARDMYRRGPAWRSTFCTLPTCTSSVIQ